MRLKERRTPMESFLAFQESPHKISRFPFGRAASIQCWYRVIAGNRRRSLTSAAAGFPALTWKRHLTLLEPMEFSVRIGSKYVLTKSPYQNMERVLMRRLN